MRDRSILGVLSVAAVCAFGCGSEKPPYAPDYIGGSGLGGGGGGGGSQADFCTAYCESIVQKPNANCQYYNANNTCTLVCGWYTATVCAAGYTAYANCLQGSTRTFCYQTSSGGWGIAIPPECATQRAALNACIGDAGVDVCPYGSI